MGDLEAGDLAHVGEVVGEVDLEPGEPDPAVAARVKQRQLEAVSLGLDGIEEHGLDDRLADAPRLAGVGSAGIRRGEDLVSRASGRLEPRAETDRARRAGYDPF